MVSIFKKFIIRCGHCKNLANDYYSLGQAMEAAKPKNVVVAKVNCVDQQNICSQYGAQGYPTIKFFAKGTAEDYQGGRSVEDFIEFLNKKTNARLLIKKTPTAVVDLTPSNFDSIALDNSKDVLVEFYAPWCGHCKSLAPKYEILAKAFASESGVVIAKVDADKHRSLGERFGVQGFPTLKFFAKGDKTPKDFNRGSEQEMLDSVNQLAGTHREINGRLNDKAGRVSELDELAKKYSDASEEERKSLLEKAKKNTDKNAHYYVKAMTKISEQGKSYAEKEAGRLGRIIENGSTSAQMLDDFQVRKNILSAF